MRVCVCVSVPSPRHLVISAPDEQLVAVLILQNLRKNPKSKGHCHGNALSLTRVTNICIILLTICEGKRERGRDKKKSEKHNDN